MIKKLIKQLRFAGGPYQCIACGRNVRTFFRFSDGLVKEAKDHGFKYSFERMETLNFNLCNCPFCLTSDRERLYLMYLDQFIFNRLDKKSNFSLLDFAPNFTFSDYIKKKGIDYTSADIFRSDVDLNLDICNMSSISDNRFDFIVCSHILEHVDSPENALNEMHRILKPGGHAIIMVPLFWDVTHTIENAAHKTEAEKCEHYGQTDHVRLFAKQDFIGRIKNAGFSINEYTVKDFDALLIYKNAIPDNAVLYIAHKA